MSQGSVNMSECTLPISLVTSKFLGSQNRIIVAGNSDTCHGIIQIQYVEQDNTFHNKCELAFKGCSVTAAEICGSSQTGKSYLAVATLPANVHSFESTNSSSSSHNQNTSRCAAVRLVDIEAAVDGANLKEAITLQHSSHDTTSSTLTSLSFYGDQEILAAANDAGDVILWDLSSGKEIRRFCGDASGITKVEFNRSGQLLTCGWTTSNQLSLWDIRCSVRRGVNVPSVASVKRVRALQHHHEDGEQHTGSSSNTFWMPPAPLFYTSVSSQSLYNKVLCGTSQGSVAIWDLRSEVVTAEYHIHACNAHVTALLAHPWKQDLLISASADGTIKTTDLLSQPLPSFPTSSSDRHTSIHIPSTPTSIHKTIISEPAGITSIDCDRDSGMLVACSVLGGLWRLPMS